MSEPLLAVHGGAGGAARVPGRSARDAARLRGLSEALRAGHAILRSGGGALDAVLAAVVVLEDVEAFNAGRGSVLRSNETAVMDASIMDGASSQAGAVAGVTRIRNPIRAAHELLVQRRHVLLFGAGAESFAAERGLPLQTPEWFVTDARREQLEELKRRGEVRLDHDSEAPGTVGAVARDHAGHLAAATSTGGMTNALPSRIGDSPLIGAGTWADDATCAVSGTGTGELFIRAALAHEVDARVRLAGEALAQACTSALARVRALGGDGGCIALGPSGDAVLHFTTSAMPRGCIGADGAARVALFAGEPLRA